MTKHVADFVVTDGDLQKKINLDEELQALKKMRNLQSDIESRLEIEGFINDRIAEIVAENKSTQS